MTTTGFDRIPGRPTVYSSDEEFSYDSIEPRFASSDGFGTLTLLKDDFDDEMICRSDTLAASHETENPTDLDAILAAVHENRDTLAFLEHSIDENHSYTSDKIDSFRGSVDAKHEEMSNQLEQILSYLPLLKAQERVNMEAHKSEQTTMKKNEEISVLKEQVVEYQRREIEELKALSTKQASIIKDKKKKIQRLKRQNKNYKSQILDFICGNVIKNETEVINEEVDPIQTDGKIVDPRKALNEKILKDAIAFLDKFQKIAVISMFLLIVAVFVYAHVKPPNKILHEDVFLTHDLRPRLDITEKSIISSAIRDERTNYQVFLKKQHPVVFEKMLRRDKELREKSTKLSREAAYFANNLLNLFGSIRFSDESESRKQTQYKKEAWNLYKRLSESAKDDFQLQFPTASSLFEQMFP